MLSDEDIWRSAQILVCRHEQDAELVAARHIGQMIQRGNPAGQLIWKRILTAIRQLQRDKAAEGERIN